MLELDFAFKILTLSLCEEFLVCASETECQSIQLNLSPSVVSGNSEQELSEAAQLRDSSTGGNVVADNGLMFPAHCYIVLCK